METYIDANSNPMTPNPVSIKNSETYKMNTMNSEGEQIPDVIISHSENRRMGHSRKRAYSSVAVLLFVNLLNYMDRYTIAGVLLDIQHYYDMSNTEAGLLQTVFIVSYMILAPIFGYLGDRFNRKYLMLIGILIWSATTLAGSFVPAQHFWLFLCLRALVGVGEASYSTIAPTLIADLFTDDMRTKMLALFYFAIPVGSGLGYIVGSNVAALMGSWHWALRVTPALGGVCCFLILFVLQEPPRGEAEGGTHLQAGSYMQDVRALCKNRSFMWSTFGFTAVAFCTGALALWAPTFMTYAYRLQTLDMDSASINLIFGVITCIAGFLGVAMGSQSSRMLKKKGYHRADPMVCASGLLLSVPFLYFALVFSKSNHIMTWILIFVGETFLCLNWALVADILLYVVIPPRRGTAEAFQILISHAFGDAGSPYVIGEISDALASQNTYPRSTFSQYYALQYSLFITAFVAVLGGFCFLITSLYVVDDKHRVEKEVKASQALTSSQHSTQQDLLPAGVEAAVVAPPAYPSALTSPVSNVDDGSVEAAVVTPGSMPHTLTQDSLLRDVQT